MESKKNNNKQLGPKRSLFLSTGLCLSLFIVFSAFQIKTKLQAPVIQEFHSPYESIPVINIKPTRHEEPKPLKLKVPVLISIESDPIHIHLPDPVITIETDQVDMTNFIEPSAEVAPEPDEIIIVEQPASFPGGMAFWQKYLQKNLKYPRQAQRMGIEGKVQLSFYVDAQGNISDIRVSRGIGGGCDQEAIRVLKKSPQWNPGLQRGNAVKSPMSIFIKFKLK